MSGNLHKVAGCRVEPYELIQRKDGDIEVEGNSVDAVAGKQEMSNGVI